MTIDEVNEALTELHDLTQSDPARAIAGARRLRDQFSVSARHVAFILCNAGDRARDQSAVCEARNVFAEQLKENPTDGTAAYHLANAIWIEQGFSGVRGFAWFQKTASERKRSRTLLKSAFDLLEDPALKSQSATNLANFLDASFRWVEAFEYWEEAYLACESNGVATGSAARMLLRVARAGGPHAPHLVDYAKRLIQHAQDNCDTVARFAGRGAAETFECFPGRQGPIFVRGPAEDMSPYENFVTANRLLLSPIQEGRAHSKQRWDDLHLSRVVEALDAGAEVPPLFAMFNVMKGEYLTARLLAFEGMSGDGASQDTGVYMSTLDYAVSGVQSTKLVLAQRSALDVLDKISVAIDDYFQVGVGVRMVNFRNVWTVKERGRPAVWRKAIWKAIANGNTALVALSDLALDLGRDELALDHQALHEPLQKARHTGTHRFMVLHDEGTGERARPNPAIEHVSLFAFQQEVIRTLKLSRAALLYFTHAVELAQGRDGKSLLSLRVTPEHQIRGEP